MTIIDSPPANVVTDAVELASYADSVLLVARAGETKLMSLKRTIEQFRRVGTPIVGIVSEMTFRKESVILSTLTRSIHARHRGESRAVGLAESEHSKRKPVHASCTLYRQVDARVGDARLEPHSRINMNKRAISRSSMAHGPLSLRANFSWTFVGNIVYSFAQWGMLIVLARLGSPELVGQFSLGLAITAPVIMLTNMQLRAIQVTDTREEYTFGDYLGLKLFQLPLRSQ